MKTSTAILVVSLSITPTLTKGMTIAQWTFETSVPTTAGPIVPEIGSGEGTAFHSDSGTAFSNPYGNGSAESWSANHWSVNDYWQFQVSTLGFKDISVSFDQYGSSTGPRNFGLFWSVDGAAFTQFGTSYTVTDGSWSSSTAHSGYSHLYDLSTITDLNNSSDIYFRLMNLSTANISGGTVGSSGADRIDNFTVCGTAELSDVPDSLPLHFAAVALVGVFAFTRRLWLQAPDRMPN